ncbi:MAG: hypothetical protein ACRD19_01310, partial [Terriglobia bacterium]
YRMLVETAEGRRRLFRRGDAYHPAREGAKITPDLDDMPHGYSGLVAWYKDWSLSLANSKTDPLIDLLGSGRQLWAGEHADDYIRRLREGWE